MNYRSFVALYCSCDHELRFSGSGCSQSVIRRFIRRRTLKAAKGSKDKAQSKSDATTANKNQTGLTTVACSIRSPSPDTITDLQKYPS